MKEGLLNKKKFAELGRDIFLIHKIVLAVIMLIIGIPLLWISLGWLIEYPKKDTPIFFVEGRITRYDLSDATGAGVMRGEIMISPVDVNLDSLANRIYYFDHFESFNRKKFEQDGGGLNKLVKMGVDSNTIKNNALELHQLIYEGGEYIDSDLKKKLKRTNQWYGFLAALMALGIGFGLFKLTGMIRKELKSNQP